MNKEIYIEQYAEAKKNSNKPVSELKVGDFVLLTQSHYKNCRFLKAIGDVALYECYDNNPLSRNRDGSIGKSVREIVPDLLKNQDA